MLVSTCEPRYKQSLKASDWQGHIRRSDEDIHSYFKRQREQLSERQALSDQQDLLRVDLKPGRHFAPPSDLAFSTWVPGLQRSQTRNELPM